MDSNAMPMPKIANETNFKTNAQNNEVINMMPVTTDTAPCNQETETAAMTAHLQDATPIKQTHTINTTETNVATSAAVAAAPAETPQTTPAPAAAALFVTPLAPTYSTSSSSTIAQGAGNTSSMKKKRNKNVAKRIELDAVATPCRRATRNEQSAETGGGQSSIKTSLSMTSLPPDDEKQESRDVIRAKLRVERPYNSLKKNVAAITAVGTNNKLHRYSWGSGHSHSSSSLHSSAATLGFCSGKDDLWAAIQTNYNYIMDTNLLDTCKEARYELEGAASVMENTSDCCFKMLDETQRSEGFCEDPKELRRWLRDMENKMEQSPSLSEATMFSIEELQCHLTEHSVLYHEIVSHARVVSACIRAASEREQQQQQQLQLQQQLQHSNNNSLAEQNNSSLSSTDELQQKSVASGEATTTSSSSTPTAAATTAAALPAATKKSEGNLDRLQNRYHLLYLKAYEVQLWLDGLLRKKTSTASVLNDDDLDDDDDSSDCEAGGATEDDLDDVASDLESDATHNSSSFGELQRCQTEEDDDDEEDVANPKHLKKVQLLHRDCIENKAADCEDGDDEQEDEDEVDCGAARFSAVVVVNTYDTSSQQQTSTAAAATLFTTLTDFEADSESSDFETLNNLRRQRKTFNELRCAQQQQQLLVLQPKVTATIVSTSNLNNNSNSSSSTNTNNSNNQFTFAPTAATNHVVALQQQLSTTAAAATYHTPMHTKLNGIAVAETQQQQHQTLLNINLKTVAATVAAQNNINSNTTMSSTTCSTATQTQILQQQQRTPPSKIKNIAIISPNCHNNNNNNGNSSNNNKSPIALRKRQQHQRHAVDISKFNRSNRKSKNCAIFYFKHLDTDNETNYGGGVDGGGSGGLSSSASHTSDLIKSADASSDEDDDDDEEGWLYSAATPATTATGGGASATQPKIDRFQSQLVADGIQSSAVSSSTTNSSNSNNIIGGGGGGVISDDSDKENKEAIAAAAATATTQRNNNLSLSSQQQQQSSASLSLNCTQIAIAEIQLQTKTTIAANNSNNLISSSSSCSHSHSSGASCCSSNDLLTETTTSATTTTAASQITQMHLHRSEMELQLHSNGHGNANNNNIINNNCSNQHNNKYQQQQPTAELKNAPQQQQQRQLKSTFAADSNGNIAAADFNNKSCFYTRADICNIVVKPNEILSTTTHQHLSLNPGKMLPPRSPAKSTISNGTMSTISPTKEISHESIKQLVLEAEHLVRDEALKTPTKPKHSFVKISTTVKKRDVHMPGPIKQRVQEWLEHQPSTPRQLSKSHEPLNSTIVATPRNDDCEASGEASENDSIPQPGSDSSEGFTDSIATCMQTSSNSFGNSHEHIGGSAEPIVGGHGNSAAAAHGSSNQSLNVAGNVVKIVRRQQSRRKSERPWSVSCLSQLTTETAQVVQKATAASNVQAGLASHSISESALDSLSPGRPRVSSAGAAGGGGGAQSHLKQYDSRSSLKRRKTRRKKLSNAASYSAAAAAASAYSQDKRTTSDSGSEEATETLQVVNKLAPPPNSLLLQTCESSVAAATMTAQQMQEIASALLTLQKSSATTAVDGTMPSQPLHVADSGEEEPMSLMKPNFRVGSYTTAYMTSEARLGSLAALATYMNDEEQQQQGEYATGNEDHHSSISETAWDDYQEKYNSENYSEGFDSDAARRLMEFGDDYRNFIDSQSDCCSSLSAANNLDSLSPPRMDSLQQNETKIISQETIVSSVDHARRRRALELEYERRRKTLEVRRKSCQESIEQPLQPRSPTISLSSSANALTPKNSDSVCFAFKRCDSAGRKLEFGMSHSMQSVRRTSESDTSTRRRKADERRRSSRNLEKCIKAIPATNSSSSDGDDTDNEKEMRNLLTQSRMRLEDTRALKIRCHLLRPEDYTEIINTCRDNIRCLEAVLRGPPSTVLSAPCHGQSKGEFSLVYTVHLDCQCAPITRFVARCIEFLLDLGNFLEHFALYRFFIQTLKHLYAMVNGRVTSIERILGYFKSIL